MDGNTITLNTLIKHWFTFFYFLQLNLKLFIDLKLLDIHIFVKH